MKRNKLVIAACLLACSSSACYVGVANRTPPALGPESTLPGPAPGSARFVTYNIVHGTGIPIPPSLVRESVVQAHLRAIGSLLHNQQPAVVALQETDHGRHADRASSIALRGQFPYWADDASITQGGLRHGAALLSQSALEEPSSATLVRGATRDKGYVSATVAVREWDGMKVRVVSLHLDPFSAKARERQVDQLASQLEHEPLPLIVLGDFNCKWEQGRCAQRLAARLGLTAAPTHATPTYSFLGIHKNLDWILVSDPFVVTSVRVLPEHYSDHLAVVAEVARKAR